jgi:hypothetical protein
MSLIIVLAVAAIALALGMSVFASSTNLKQFVQRNYKYFIALSALLVPTVVILSACQSLE